MRIHLQLNSSSRAASAEAPFDTTGLPSALTSLTPNGELVLIELQGDLELDGVEECGGGAQTLGQLSFEKGIKEHPVLTISHHKLQGKIVNLQKPLAIIEKRKRGLKRRAVAPPQRAEQAEQKQDEVPDFSHQIFEETMQDPVASCSVARHSLSLVQTRNTPLEAEAPATAWTEVTEDKLSANLSPTVAHKRPKLDDEPDPAKSSSPIRAPLATDTLDFSSSPPVKIPSSDPVYDRSSVPGSSPIRRNARERSPEEAEEEVAGIDKGADTTREEAQEEVSDEKASDTSKKVAVEPTEIYYEVVNIIRRKIVFSKRPEPLVTLTDGQTGLANFVRPQSSDV